MSTHGKTLESHGNFRCGFDFFSIMTQEGGIATFPEVIQESVVGGIF